eukprot:Skav229759  [mRNA]  locus=scaffold3154:48068:49719:+ [translate_table: standard]
MGQFPETSRRTALQFDRRLFAPRIELLSLPRLAPAAPNVLVIGVIHKKPKEGGISAVGGTGSIYTFYGTWAAHGAIHGQHMSPMVPQGFLQRVITWVITAGPDEPLFKSLTENFLKKDLPHVMPSLDLAEEPLPLWWTTDFINASPPGRPHDRHQFSDGW